MSEQQRTYSIGEVAERLGIATSAIRYYDRKDILPDVGRTDGGIRKFTEADIDWLRMIEHLKMSGMTIAEVGDYIELFQKGDETIPERRELVHNRRKEIKRQMEKLKKTLDFIDYKCWYYDITVEAGTCDAPRNMPEEEMPERIRIILKECQIKTRH